MFKNAYYYSNEALKLGRKIKHKSSEINDKTLCCKFKDLNAIMKVLTVKELFEMAVVIIKNDKVANWGKYYPFSFILIS